METRKEKVKDGGSLKEIERVRILGRENGRRTIEAITVSLIHTDSSGYKSPATHKGYHYVALLEGKKQLSFAIDFTKSRLRGWRVLSDDCVTFVKDVKTKKEAIELLTTASKEAN